MATVRLISREEAQQTRTPKGIGARRLRMDEFDAYARALVENPGEAAVFEGLEEEPQRFVNSLRAAFTRAGVTAMVRKMRSRDEVRAWVVEPAPAQAPEAPAPKRGGRRKPS